MNKRLLSVFLSCLLLLGGCGQVNKETYSNDSEQIEEKSSTENSDIGFIEEGAISESEEMINTVSLENISQYEENIAQLWGSPVKDTILVQLEEEDDEYLLTNSEGNILFKFDWHDDVCGIFIKKEDGKKKVYKTIRNDQGGYLAENITDLFITETCENIKIMSEMKEPVVWVTDVLETYDSHEYRLTAYDNNGKMLNSWMESDFQTDAFGSGYNESEIFQKLSIEYHGDNVFSITTNRSDESFIICPDTGLVMPRGNVFFVNAFGGKIFLDGVCYDKNGNLLWDKAVEMNGNILRGQHEGTDLIGYLQNESVVFINMDGNEMFQIPLISKLDEFNGFTKECPYAVFTFKNEGGTNYTTLYDKSGNMLYEPVKGKEYICNEDPIDLREKGYLILDDGENLRLIDSTGNIAIDFERDKYRNDFALAGNKLFQFLMGEQRLIVHDI